MPIKFPVKHKRTQEIMFEAEISAAEDTPIRDKLGLAIIWAASNSVSLVEADLRGANLTSRILSSCDFTGADLSGAVVIDSLMLDVILTDANLSNTRIEFTHFVRCNFAGTSLNDAEIKHSFVDHKNMTLGNSAPSTNKHAQAKLPLIPLFHQHFEPTETRERKQVDKISSPRSTYRPLPLSSAEISKVKANQAQSRKIKPQNKALIEKRSSASKGLKSISSICLTLSAGCLVAALLMPPLAFPLLITALALVGTATLTRSSTIFMDYQKSRVQPLSLEASR